MYHSQEKLQLLRASMKENNIDIYIIPDTDPHMNEYLPDYWRIIYWLTGFTGSSATVVVTSSFSGLWTDSRYTVQAGEQLAGSDFVLMMPQSSDKNSYLSWIHDNISPGITIGLDGKTFPVSRLKKLKQTIGDIAALNIESDLISGIWNDRPPLPASIAFEHDIKYCGKDRSSKLAEVRDEMKKVKADYHLLSSPDDIMWLLNIRGGDIRYSPILLSFAIIGMEQVLLFADENKINFKIAREFDRLGIIMLPYEEAGGMITTLDEGTSVFLDPAVTSAELYYAIPAGVRVIEDVSIPVKLKALLNRTEIENLERAMVKDAVALTKFFHWVEINAGSLPMSEMSLTEKLNHFRAAQEDYISLSFPTIIAWNEHAALPHYTASTSNDSVIGNQGLLLVDSGSQYLDGTTDITRTIAIGRPDKKLVRDFTMVLKGMIDLARAVFPSGTTGTQLDILARKSLWESGLNYGHGTGHGVGFCLNVHEGPHSISPSAVSGTKSPILPGMLVSDEPGIYRQGEYGIRIENLLLCYEYHETEFGKFFRFETMSWCYIDKLLIDISLLDKDEIAWLNDYHAATFQKISSHLGHDERKWLKGKTDPF